MSGDRTTAAAVILDDAGGDSTSADRAFLVVYYGHGQESRGRVVPLPDSVAVTFGRNPSNAVAIEHEMVSRTHARVIRLGADIVVEDLGSRNGTRVNGALADGPTRVSTGDEITIGPATAIVGVTTGVRRRMLVGSASQLEERLDAEIDRAVRYRRVLALAMIRIEGPASAEADAVDSIGRSLRKMDYLAQYGPNEYALLLPEADGAAAEAAARRIRQGALVSTAGRKGVSVHIGVAVCPEHGTQSGGLMSSARAALRAARTGGEPGIASAPDEMPPGGRHIVIADPLMKRVFAMARKVADTPITVLVQGETGTGKEIVASAVHQHSDRAGRPFITLNCSALPETLLESELFGHERGAFTGADRRKVGYFEAAAGGTIFLDELGEMPLGVQAKLLRVLEQRTITRVGGTQSVPIDVRVLCATNRDLEREVERGRFREDLYFRVSAFTVVVPPLRDRRSEIIPFAHYFAEQFARELGQPAPRVSDEAAQVLSAYKWPGNVRELRNAIERAVVLLPGEQILPTHLPERVIAGAKQATSQAPAGAIQAARRKAVELEKDAVVAALQACGGNQTRAARRLGISRFALIRLMQKYGLKKPGR